MYSEAKRKSYEAISLLLVKPASLLNFTLLYYFFTQLHHVFVFQSNLKRS